MRGRRYGEPGRGIRPVLAPAVAATTAGVVGWWAITAGTLIDTVVFRSAAHAVLAGQSPYVLRTVVPFVYPPAGVLAILPTALGSSVGAAATVWVGLSLAALARTTWVLVAMAWPSLDRRQALRRTCWLFAVACVLEPTLITLSFGQVGLLLLWLTVEGLGTQPGGVRRTWLVGVAAAVKITPAIVLVGLAAAGRWRTAAWGVVGLVGASVAAAVAAPAAVRDYVGGSWGLAQDVNATPDLLNHSVIGVVAVVGLPAGVGLGLAAAVLVLGIALTARLWRDGDELAGLATVLVTGLLVSPVSWGHHWVAVYPGLVLLLREVRARRAGVVVLLSTAVLGMLLQVDGLGLQGSRVLPPGEVWQVAQRDWPVAWGIAFLAWAGVALLVRRAEVGSTPSDRTAQTMLSS